MLHENAVQIAERLKKEKDPVKRFNLKSALRLAAQDALRGSIWNTWPKSQDEKSESKRREEIIEGIEL